MTLAPPPSNGDPQPVDSMTDLRFAIARARADRRAAPSSDGPQPGQIGPCQTWNHQSKGRIHGVEVRGDETWMHVRLVGDHRMRWLSPGRARSGEVTPDGEVVTLRRSFMTLVPDDVPVPPAPSQRDPELAAALNEQRRQSYNAETLRTRPVPSSDTPNGERANAADDVTWACKIGPASRGDLPSGSDAPMRAAVEAAFRKLTGHDPEWTFSGWAHDLTEAERAVVEDRLPRPRVIAAAARGQMERAEAVIGTDLDPEAPERGWEIHEPDDALKITASDDTTPSSDTPSGERATLTPRQEAIEAILIRYQDHAFSFVARRIDALFTTPAPSSSPVGDRVLVGEASVDDAPVWYSADEASAWAGGWDACLRALAPADRGEPTQ